MNAVAFADSGVVQLTFVCVLDNEIMRGSCRPCEAVVDVMREGCCYLRYAQIGCACRTVSRTSSIDDPHVQKV